MNDPKISIQDFDKIPAFTEKVETATVESKSISTVETASVANVTEISDAMAEGFPDEFAGMPDSDTPTPSVAQETDAMGAVFDPNKHKSENGRPVKNEEGKFVRLYRKRYEQPSAPFPTQQAPAPDQFDAAGRIASMWQIRLVGIMFDPDEAKTSPEFERELSNAYSIYFRANNMAITSPGMNLVFVAGAHIAETVQKPKSKEKFAKMVTKVFGYIKSKFKRRE